MKKEKLIVGLERRMKHNKQDLKDALLFLMQNHKIMSIYIRPTQHHGLINQGVGNIKYITLKIMLEHPLLPNCSAAHLLA